MTMLEKKRIRTFIAAVLALILLLLLWVRQTVRSMQIAYHIRAMETEIKKEQRKQTDLERQKNTYLTLSNLENAAKTSGLIVPREEEVITIIQ
jgi:cell division protein FtsL